LLIRQVHHWSADLFVAAICLRLLRAFFRGRFSGRALPGWLIWVVLLPLGMLAADWFNDIIEHRQFVQLGLIPSEFSGSHSKPSTPKSTTRPTGSPSAASGKAQPREHRRTKRYQDDGRAILAVTERVRRSVHHEGSSERPAQPQLLSTRGALRPLTGSSGPISGAGADTPYLPPSHAQTRSRTR